MSQNFNRQCFVCESPLLEGEYTIEPSINLPVCNTCKDTEDEKKKIQELLEGMADGFVCGCI